MTLLVLQLVSTTFPISNICVTNKKIYLWVSQLIHTTDNYSVDSHPRRYAVEGLT